MSWPVGLFEEWQLQTIPIVCLAVRNCAGWADDSCCRDMAQEALARAWPLGHDYFCRGHEDSTPHRNFIQWCRRTACNAVISEGRKRKRIQQDDCLDVVSTRSGRRLFPAIRECLSRISTNSRQLLEMRFDNDMTYLEIGQAWHGTDGNGTGHLSDSALVKRAREKLLPAALNELRGEIYKAGVDPDTWPSVLDTVDRAISSEQVEPNYAD